MLKMILIQLYSDRNNGNMSCIPVCALVTVLLLQTNTVESFKILGIFPTNFKSHIILGSALMKELAAAGHNVTVMSAFPDSKPIPNYRLIHVNGIEEALKGKYIRKLLT